MTPHPKIIRIIEANKAADKKLEDIVHDALEGYLRHVKGLEVSDAKAVAKITAKAVALEKQVNELSAKLGATNKQVCETQFKRMHEPMNLNEYANTCHEANQKWWHDSEGNRIDRNKGELLCLIHSEVSEAMEGERKGLMDDKLPHRRMAEVELVDALIRIFDYAGGFGYDLQGAFEEKMAFNATRKDHTHEARAEAGGKKF